MTDARPIALVGFMGSGKSAVGSGVAAALGWTLADSDNAIEARLGRSIARIFEESGEATFREVEREVVLELVERPRSVIALGGGAFCAAGTRARLRVAARTVWLDAPLESCRSRVGAGACRPLWTTDPLDLRALYERRRAAYALACHRIDASGPPDRVVREVLSLLLQDSR